MVSSWRERILPIYYTWSAASISGILSRRKLLEWVHRRATKLTEGLEPEDRLRHLGAIRLRKRRFWGDLSVVFQCFNAG